MAKCINTSHPDFIRLEKESGMDSFVLEVAVSDWQSIRNTDEFPSLKDITAPNQVQYVLKAVDILSSDKAKQVFEKGRKNSWSLDKVLTELQVPKEQKQLILDKDIAGREEIITSLLADSTFVVEINTAKKQPDRDNTTDGFVLGNKYYTRGYSSTGEQRFEVAVIIDTQNFQMWKPDTFTTPKEITKEQYLKAREQASENTRYYANLTVPGGTNYTESEIATPAITPSIKGHAQFSTDNGIGWFRSDDKHPFTGFLEDLIASGTIKKVPCG